MTAIIVSTLVIASSAFVLLAAIGFVRMPDLYTKMHAVSKAGAFGGTLALLGAAIYFGTSVWILIGAIVCFFFFSTPVGTQMLAKSAAVKSVKTWQQTRS